MTDAELWQRYPRAMRRAPFYTPLLTAGMTLADIQRGREEGLACLECEEQAREAKERPCATS